MKGIALGYHHQHPGEGARLHVIVFFFCKLSRHSRSHLFTPVTGPKF